MDRLEFRVTLKHEAIPSAGLTAGTNEFPVKNAAAVANVRPGDHVAFQLEKQGEVWMADKFTPIAH